MNSGNLTIKVWAIALSIFVALYILAIKEEKDAKAALKANKQASSELTALKMDYLDKTSLSGYDKAKSSLGEPIETIHIKKGDLGNTKTKRQHRVDYKLDVLGL